MDSLDNNDLFLHNYEGHTHIDSSTGRKSDLDLFLSTTDIAHLIGTELLPDTMGSDHYLVTANLSVGLVKYENKSQRTNWAQYNEVLLSEFSDFLTADYEELTHTGQYEFFMRKITQAAATATPTRKKVDPKRHRNPIPWWDAECDRHKRLRQAAHKR